MKHLRTYAGITWSSTGTSAERVHHLAVPLRDLHPGFSRSVYASDSLDRSVREVFTVGNGAHEFEGTVRFDDDPQSLLDLVKAGVSGLTLTYYPDLREASVGYACQMISPGGEVLALLSDTQRVGNATLPIRLRVTSGPAQPIYQGTNVLFWYRAGDSLESATFARASTATVIGKGYGVVSSVASGKARLSWVDTDGDKLRELPALRLEAARTNLTLRSEELENGSWSLSRSSVAADDANAPDGNTTADKLIEDTTASNTHFASQVITVSAGARLAGSCFFRPAERTEAVVRLSNGSDLIQVRGDFSAGTATGTASGNGAVVASGIEKLDDEWWRIWIVGTVNAGSTAITQSLMLSSGGSTSYTGDGSSGLHAWGAHAGETTAGPTSYIPTTSATVTRSADTLQFPFAARPQAMTAYVRFVEGGTILSASSPRVFTIGGSTIRLVLFATSAGRYRIQYTNAAGTSVTSQASSAPSVGDLVELRCVLNTDGSVQLGQTLNNGTEVTGTASGSQALPTKWGAQTLDLNSVGSSAVGINDYLNVVFLRGAQTLETMRRVARV